MESFVQNQWSLSARITGVFASECAEPFRQNQWCLSTRIRTGTRLRIEVQGELAALISEMEAFKRAKNSIHPRLLCNESGAELSYDALRQRFDKARTKAKLTHHQIQFRDLRAKAATDKAETTGDIRQAQKQLGHANLSMTEHYTRQRKGDLVKPTK